MSDSHVSRAAWVLLLVLSVILHFWDLGVRSFHSDEAVHAQSAYSLLHDGEYRYDPTFHGPLLYYLVAASYAVFGDGDFTARLPIALSSIAALALAYRLREKFGAWPAWWSGLLFTISPTLLYYGRFLRMDLLEVVTTCAALLCLHDAVTRRSTRAWVWFGLWTGLAVATKENAYVSATLVVFTLALLMPVKGFEQNLDLTRRWIRDHGTGFTSASLVVLIVTVCLYTAFFRHPQDWLFPVKSISYWSLQHEVERVAGPASFYLPRLALYEFLPLAAASVWVWRQRFQVAFIEAFLYLFGLSSILMYAYLGEKVPWLATHQIWPFVPLAGAQLARSFGPSGRWWSRSLAVLALGATFASAIAANFVLDEISPRRARVEALIYVQTTPEYRELAQRGLRLAGADDASRWVASVHGTGVWPLRWYWRHLPVWWSPANQDTKPDLVVTDLENELEARLLLGPSYLAESIAVRAWWIPDFGSASLRDLARYVLARVPWGVIGSSDVVLLKRTRQPRMRARSVATPASLARHLPVEGTLVFGEQWLIEPRGIAVSAGKIAVADARFSRVVVFDEEGAAVRPLELPVTLSEPEDVAWHPDGELFIADTWNHRVLEVDLKGVVPPRDLSLPGRLYGPRNVAVSPRGRIAVVDTGNKRVLLSSPDTGISTVIGGGGHEPGRLDEPVGAAWVGEDRLLVADVGNRRVQLFDARGNVLTVVSLPGAWPSYQSRAQIAVLDEDLWLVTDTLNAALWLIRGTEVVMLPLGSEGIRPAGLAWDPHSRTLYMTDLNRRVWGFRTRL